MREEVVVDWKGSSGGIWWNLRKQSQFIQERGFTFWGQRNTGID